MARKQDAALDVLQGCVKALESSVSSSMANLTKSLASSVDMMRNMNAMMEEYLVKSVKINVHWRRRPCRTVSCAVVNQGRLGLRDVQIVVFASSAENPSASDSDVLSEKTCKTLASGEKLLWDIDSIPSKKSFSKIHVKMTFPSPGTGNELVVRYNKQVLMWDLFKFKPLEQYNEDHKNTKNGGQVSKLTKQRFETIQDVQAAKHLFHAFKFPAQTIRQYLWIHPLHGLNLPTSWYSTHPQHDEPLILTVTRIPEDSEAVQVILHSKGLGQSAFKSVESDLRFFQDRMNK